MSGTRRALECLVNWLLRRCEASGEALVALEGRRFLFSSTEPTLRVVCRVASGQLCLLSEPGAAAPGCCAELSGPASAWLELWSAADWRAALAGGALAVRGDAAAAGDLAAALQGLRALDLERPLAALCGDLAAHRLGQGARWLARAHGDARRSLWRQLHEFLVEGAGASPTAAEAAAALRGAVARRARRLADAMAAR